MTLVNQMSARPDAAADNERNVKAREAKQENARKDFERTVEENKTYRSEIGQDEGRVSTPRQRGEDFGTYETVEGNKDSSVKKGSVNPSERSGQKD